MTIGFFWVAREWYSYCFSADSRQAQSLRQLYFATSVVESRDVSCCFDVVNAKKKPLAKASLASGLFGVVASFRPAGPE